MADVISAIITTLAADSPVAALVSTRIYPDQLPQGDPRRPGPAKLPAVRVQAVTGGSVHHMSSASGLASLIVDVDSYSLTRAGATALEDAVRLALDRYVGTVASVRIDQIISGDRRDNYEPPADSSDVGAYVSGRTYTIWHRESV